jgi:hypothetical protein
LVLVSACKQLQENQSVAWISKTKEKNPPKQERLVFLETTVHRRGETAEKQRKTREKTKVAENQVFWLDICAKKKGLCITSQGKKRNSPHLLFVLLFVLQDHTSFLRANLTFIQNVLHCL